ncbi:MAG: magnesium transporter, partial [Verrucomicrobiales bacterium]|nr:magnesium transporter [Verrucomicrobiales bacterium]
GQVLDDLSANAETYQDHDVQYAYVVDAEDRLLGVLRLRDLVLTPRGRALGSIMIRNPMSVPVTMTVRELARLFDEKPFIGLPVVDEKGALQGVVQRAVVQEVMAEGSAEDFLRSRGIVGGEELRAMPLVGRCLRRLSWLAPNIVLNLVAASVIAVHEKTLAAVIALAVFLPIVSDMSGCSGNQAVAVSIRELTLGILRPRDFFVVFVKEGLVGIINGCVLGALLGAVAALWKGSIFLGLVVGGALALNTVLSVLIGGLVPLALKRFKIDPALASGPILTTCTDLCGFFLVLSLANLWLDRLAGL